MGKFYNLLTLKLTIKYVLLVINVLCVLLSVAVIAAASLALYTIDTNNMVCSDECHTWVIGPIVWLLLGIGSLLCTVCGFCGIIRNSKYMLRTFTAVLVLLIVCKIAIGVYLLVNDRQIHTNFIGTLEHKWSNKSAAKELLDSFIQTKFKCCGYENKADWNNTIPLSCCDSTVSSCTIDNAFSEGCKSVLQQYFDLLYDTSSYGALTWTGLDLVSVCGAFILMDSVIYYIVF